MNHPNFIIRNYLMGELAGGSGGEERSAEGRGFLGSQPRLCSLPATQFRSRTICLFDVGLEHGGFSECPPRLHPEKPDQGLAQTTESASSNLTREHSDLYSCHSSDTNPLGVFRQARSPCLSFLIWRVRLWLLSNGASRDGRKQGWGWNPRISGSLCARHSSV